MAARKRTTRRRAPPPPPWWKTAEGLAKALVVVAAAIGILWTTVGIVYRHFRGAEIAHEDHPVVEQIPALAEIVTNSQAVLDVIVEERSEAAQRTKFIQDECRVGNYPRSRCKGFPHPDDPKARK
jgi:uncharacterized membrane protein